MDRSALRTMERLLVVNRCADDLVQAMEDLLRAHPSHDDLWQKLTADATKIKRYTRLAIEIAEEVMDDDLSARLRAEEAPTDGYLG